MKNELIEDILILYVEDDEDIRTEIEYFLNKKFKNVKVASNGKIGHDIYLEYNPDIIITDIRMPVMDGIEMCKTIRESDKTTPIIITSAYTDSEYLDEAIKIGINTFLLKPISLMQLYCTLKITAEHILLQRKNAITQDELDDTRSLLVEADKMANLGSLVAGATHEINTPLGIGLTSISHLLDETKELKSSYENELMTQEMFEKHLHSSIELLSMVDINLKRASQLVKTFKKVAVDQTVEDRREFKLKEYIEEIIFSLNYVLKRTNLKVNILCKNEISIVSCPGSLSQIFTNLIMNSIKHAYEDGQEGIITIEILLENNCVFLIFSDDGKGISSEKQEKIFDKFYTTKKYQGGTGLGLNIVKDLVTSKLHGNISCKSELGSGTKFTISFPI